MIRDRLRAWLEPRVRCQRARVVAAESVRDDLDGGQLAARDMIGQQMSDIIVMHNQQYHPGYGCAENERGQCWDRHGGTRAAGMLGEHTRETT